MNFIDHIFQDESGIRIFLKNKKSPFPGKPEKGLGGGVMNNQQGITIKPY